MRFSFLYTLLALVLCGPAFAQMDPQAVHVPTPDLPPPVVGNTTFGSWTLQVYDTGTAQAPFFTCLLGSRMGTGPYLELRAQQMTGVDLVVMNPSWSLISPPGGEITIRSPEHLWSWPAKLLSATELQGDLSQQPDASSAFLDDLIRGPQALQVRVPTESQVFTADTTGLHEATNAFGQCMDHLPHTLPSPT